MIHCIHSDAHPLPDDVPDPPSIRFPPEFSVTGHPVKSSRQIELPRERYRVEYYGVDPDIRGETVDPAHFPAWGRFDRPEPNPKDFYETYLGWKVVSTRVMRKIEELEPGVHQFIPFRLLQADGSDPWSPYYFLNIRQIIFSIDEPKSPCYKWRQESFHAAGEAFPVPMPKGWSQSTRRLAFTSYVLRYDKTLKPGKTADGKEILIVYRSAIVGSRVIWREYLDLNTPPNSGKRAWVDFGDNDQRLWFLEPAQPGDWDIYKLSEYEGFRATEQFTNWVKSEGITGFSFWSAGCLDIELQETAR